MLEIPYQQQVPRNYMNNGERAELKFKATLGIYNQSIVKFKNNPNNFKINKIEVPYGNGLRLINPYNENITAQYIDNLSDSNLEIFCQNNGILKSGPFSKADIFINGKGYSLKYTSAMPPALINHTRRSGWEFAAKHKGINLDKLDSIVADYWQKRTSGIIGEDIPNSDPNSPFRSHFTTLFPFLEYFIFEGTGSRLSIHPASEVIEFSDPCNLNTWDLLDRNNLIKNIWPRLVFSMRSGKGMPTDINAVNAAEKSSILVWAKNMQGNLKGALHVRIK
jgi:hypothetical protein